MGRSRSRFYATAAVVLALLVATAGCSGLTGGDGDGGSPAGTTTAADPGTTTGSDPGGDGTTATSGDDGTTAATTATTTDAAQGGFGDYEFSDGDTFVYSAALTNTSSRIDVRWRVTDVSGEELAVEVSYGYGGNFGETKTFEGTKGEVFEALSFESDHLGELVFLSLRIGPSLAADHSLSVGNTWTATAEDLPPGVPTRTESFQVEVTGTAEYGGVECTNIRVTNESGSGGSGATYCVNPEYPFSLASDTEGVEGTDVSFEGTSTGEGGETGETTTTTSTGRDIDVPGTADSEVDGLGIVDHRLVAGEGDSVREGSLAVVVTVENTGDQSAEVLFEYSYRVTLYDDSGAEIVSGFAGKMSRSDTALAPGETANLILTAGQVDPDRIGRYEVTLTCRSFDEGVYCE